MQNISICLWHVTCTLSTAMLRCVILAIWGASSLLSDNCDGAAGAVVFGVQRLTPTYNMSFYKSLRKPT